ncbi:MAG: hypothetical protein ACI9IV_001480 [Paracoccaceae bacterium]|jgi:hypothetical protein
MSNLYWLNEDRMARLRPYFPKSHDVPRADEVVLLFRTGLRLS